LQAEENRFAETISRSCWFESTILSATPFAAQSTVLDRTEDIFQRLKTYDSPLPPPKVPSWDRVLPSSPSINGIDVEMMLDKLNPFLCQLTQYSQ